MAYQLQDGRYVIDPNAVSSVTAQSSIGTTGNLASFTPLLANTSQPPQPAPMGMHAIGMSSHNVNQLGMGIKKVPSFFGMSGTSTTTPMISSSSTSDPKQKPRILDKLKQLRDAGKYCDIIINVKGRQFLAHKNVLAAWSPLFDIHMSDDDDSFSQKEMMIVHYDNHEVFSDLLDFLYSGSIAFRETNFMQLLHLAVSFQIDLLRSDCEEYLRSNLHLGNFLKTFFLSIKYKLTALEDFVLDYLQKNLSNAVTQNEFLSLSVTKLDAFLSSGNMATMKPEVKLFLIISWVGFEVPGRQKYLVVLLKHIDWSTVASDFLHEISLTDNFFTSHESGLFLLLQTLYSSSISLGPYKDIFPSLQQTYSYLLADVLGVVIPKEAIPEAAEYIPVLITVPPTAPRTEMHLHSIPGYNHRDIAVNTDVTGPDVEAAMVVQPIPLPQIPSINATLMNSNYMSSISQMSTNCINNLTNITSSINTLPHPVTAISSMEAHGDATSMHSTNVMSNMNQTGVIQSTNLGTSSITETFHSSAMNEHGQYTTTVHNLHTLAVEQPHVQHNVVYAVNNQQPIQEFSTHGNGNTSEEHITQETVPVQNVHREPPKHLSYVPNKKYRKQWFSDSVAGGSHEFECSKNPSDNKVHVSPRKRPRRSDKTTSKYENYLQTVGAKQNSELSEVEDEIIPEISSPIPGISEEYPVLSKELTQSKNTTSAEIPLIKDVSKKVKHNLLSKGKKLKSLKSKKIGFYKMRKHTGAKKSVYENREKKCRKCDFVCNSVQELQTHLSDRHPRKAVQHTCDICAFTDKGKIFFNHMRDHYPGPPHKCNYEGCSYEGHNIHSLLLHMPSHTGLRKYHCKMCSMAFLTRNNLIQHNRTHTEARPYKCDICGSSYKTNSTLGQHKAVHSETKTYLCDLCGFSTRYQSHLKAHSRIHTGEVFCCKEEGCDYYAVKKSQLKNHMKKHSDVREFFCNVCNRGFKESTHLSRHMLTHEDTAEQFLCTDVSGVECEFKSKRKDKLKEHLKRYHSEESSGKVYKPRDNKSKLESFEKTYASRDSKSKLESKKGPQAKKANTKTKKRKVKEVPSDQHDHAYTRRSPSEEMMYSVIKTTKSPKTATNPKSPTSDEIIYVPPGSSLATAAATLLSNMALPPNSDDVLTTEASKDSVHFHRSLLYNTSTTDDFVQVMNMPPVLRQQEEMTEAERANRMVSIITEQGEMVVQEGDHAYTQTQQTGTGVTQISLPPSLAAQFAQPHRPGVAMLMDFFL